MTKNEKLIIILAVCITAGTGVMNYSNANAVFSFIVSAAALALLAMIVGDATEQLGNRFGPAATGILQSALGNLPELFVCIFALRAGLDQVVQAALIGSILGNSVLVLGLAFLVGGLKNGRQQFKSESPKTISILMILAIAAMTIPTLTHELHTQAEGHLMTLDKFLAVVMLVLFIGSLFFSLRKEAGEKPEADQKEGKHSKWSLSLTLIVLFLASIGAAFVSDWFIVALEPAMESLGINEVFAGLVIVAIAGNAIENVIGIQLAYRNKMDYSVSIIQNSSLQISLVLFPVLVLLSMIMGGAVLTFVLSPMLLVCMILGVIVSTFIIFDGESIWIEGLALIGLYLLIAAAFWWG